jgi:Asp-tRNA(Asn)/Glu-tRNA(Gln) amidotransferase A subunit family amidase
MVARIRAAGAIVLAKANPAEWAFTPYETVRSILPGYTKNPYALDGLSGDHRADGVHARRPAAGGDHVLRARVERGAAAGAGVRLRAGDPAPSAAGLPTPDDRRRIKGSEFLIRP